MITIQEWIAKRLPSRDGWCKPIAAQSIYNHLMSEPGPLYCVEIGACGGRSFFPAVFSCRDHPKGGKSYGIDAYDGNVAAEFMTDLVAAEWWRTKATHAKARQQVEREIVGLKLEAFAELIVAKSQDVAERFKDITYLSIDGNHNREAVARDIDLYLPLVVSGGLIRMDDTVNHPGVTTELVRVVAVCDFVDSADDGQWEIWRKR